MCQQLLCSVNHVAGPVLGDHELDGDEASHVTIVRLTLDSDKRIASVEVAEFELIARHHDNLVVFADADDGCQYFTGLQLLSFLHCLLLDSLLDLIFDVSHSGSVAAAQLQSHVKHRLDEAERVELHAED